MLSLPFFYCIYKYIYKFDYVYFFYIIVSLTATKQMPSFTTPKYFVVPTQASYKIAEFYWTKNSLKTRVVDEITTYTVDDSDERILEVIKALLSPSIANFEKLSDDERLNVWYDELARIEEEERQEMIAEKHWKWMNPHI